MSHQLRIYQIKPGRMDDFVSVFRKVEPVRRAAGFEVIGPWIDAERNRFIWIAGYSGDDGFETADRRYYDSPGRAAVDPPPTDFIEAIETTMMTGLDPS